MTSQEKICQILKEIREKSEISYLSKLVDFRFNPGLIGDGILSAQDEKNILLKMEKEGIIKIHAGTSDVGGEIIGSQFSHEEIVASSLNVGVELLENFDRYYNKHCNNLSLKLKRIGMEASFWQWSNPFYLVWMCLALIWKHKMVSFIIAVVGALTIDYSLAWSNVRKIIEFFTR